MVTVNLAPAERRGWRRRSRARSDGRCPGSRCGCWTTTARSSRPATWAPWRCAGQTCSPATGRTASDGPDPDGWFATGDLRYADDDGDCYLVGRRSDLVLVNGFNVYPAEVEAVLAAARGGRGGGAGRAGRRRPREAIVAYVVPEPARCSIRTSCSSRPPVAGPVQAAAPDHRGRQLPHTATGKVMKWRLRAAASGAATGNAATGNQRPAARAARRLSRCCCPAPRHADHPGRLSPVRRGRTPAGRAVGRARVRADAARCRCRSSPRERVLRTGSGDPHRRRRARLLAAGGGPVPDRAGPVNR